MWWMLLAGVTAAQQPQADRLAWWREAKFGMFIHWGLYAIPAGEWKGKRIPGIGEWIMHNAQIPVHEYEQLVHQFNPTEFNADEWVQLAKEAGMRYITITTKHHDGFCLFDSALTDYDIMSTPFKRDIIRELVDACRRHGIRIQFYYSLLDWHHPHYVPRPKWVQDPPGHQRDFNRYLDYMFGQIRELCEKYRPDGIWFDGGWEHPPQEWRAEELLKMIWSILPNAVINNRTGLPADYDTPEQYVPAAPPRTAEGRRLWETCMTMNDTWGYRKDDFNYKSVRQLIQTLVDIVSKGGNFLLNVGPMANGKIPREQVVRLKQMGAWLRQFGEAIYGTEPSPFLSHPHPVGGCTVKGNRLFVHLFEYPTDPVELWGLKTKVRRAFIMKDGTPVEFKQEGLSLTLDLPPIIPDPYDTIVVLELEGAPEVDLALRQAKDGSIDLHARFAVVHGKTARYEHGGGKDNIGFWTDANDWVSWDFVVERGGTFQVEITYACDKGTGGSEFVVEVAGQKLTGVVEETGSWTNFVTKPLGTVTLQPGRYTLAVRPVKKPGMAVMNLQRVKLLPQQ
jgi:alpha-L-fucosidase